MLVGFPAFGGEESSGPASVKGQIDADPGRPPDCIGSGEGEPSGSPREVKARTAATPAATTTTATTTATTLRVFTPAALLMAITVVNVRHDVLMGLPK
jgi:hypothetical protein